MKRAHLILNLALVLCLFTASANGATITWASGASGNWSNPANWNPNQVPGSADTAVITASGNYTVTVDTTVTVNTLLLGSSDTSTQTVLLNGQSLAIGQSAIVNTNGVINMSSGALAFDNNGGSIMNGTLVCSGGALGGVLTIASNGVANLAAISEGNTQGVDFVSLILTNNGTILWSNIDLECSSAQVYNYGLWDAQSDNTFFGDDGGGGPYVSTFNNYGTVRKDGGSAITTFDSAMIFTNCGTVDVETAQINIDVGYGGGLFNTATNAVLSLGAPDFFNLSGSATFTGPGLVGGNLYGYNTGGVIYGSLNFYSGSLGGFLTVATNAVVNLAGISGDTQAVDLVYLTLTNYGTVAWRNIDLQCSSAQVDNFGLWDAQSDNTFFGGDGFPMTIFNNYGTVRKDGGSAITTFDSATIFTNCGTVDVETAQINVDVGYGGGLFNTATNAVLWLGIPNNFNLSGCATFTGPGLVGGNLNGNYPASVLHGTLNFYYGSLEGYLTVASNAVVNLGGITAGTQAVDLVYLTLTNYGTVAWSTIDLDCSSAQVYNYGLWDAQSDNTFFGGAGVPTTIFNNYGTVRKDGGIAITTFDSATTFNNYGSVDVETAQIDIDSGGGGGLFNTATNATVLLGIPNNFNLSGCATFTGPGLVGGNLYGNNPAGVLHGSLNFYYGSLEGYLTVASNAVVNLGGIAAGTQAVDLVYLTLTNYGTVAWSTIDLDCSSAQVCNYGLWDAQSDNTFYGNGSTFNNYGIVRKDGGSFSATTFDGNTTFTNCGTVDVETAQMNIDTGSGGGLFNTASNAVVVLGLENGFGLSGNVTFTGPGVVNGFLVGGGVYGNNSAGVIHGSLNFCNGTLGGYLTVASNAVANLSALGEIIQPVNLNYLSLTNCGTVIWSNIDLYCSNVQIYNHGLWDALSDNTFYGFGGFLPYLSSTFNNYGTVRKDGGTAVTTFDNSTIFNNLGKTDAQKGQVALEGSCSLTNGTLNVGICGPNHFGSIDFPNGVQLAGRLSVNFRNHYTPVVSNSFPVVVYGSEAGAFTSLCLPPLSPGLGWQTNYTSTAFTLSTVAASPLRLSAELSVSGDSMSLSWDGLLGQTYQVQCTTNLDPANWVNLGDPITGTNGPLTVLDSISASPNKYYRVESQ